MAENLQTSPNSVKQSTRKTSKLTREQVLDILVQSFRMVEEAGIQIEVGADNTGTTIRLEGVQYTAGGFLVPIKIMD